MRISVRLAMAALLVLLAACGGDDDDTNPTSTTESADTTTSSTTTEATAAPPETTACDLVTADEATTVLERPELHHASVGFSSVEGVGLVETCGLGPALDSFVATVSLGLEPVEASVLEGRGEPVDIGDAGFSVNDQLVTVGFVVGETYGEVSVPNFRGENLFALEMAQELARTAAARMPDAPADEVGVDPDGACVDLDAEAIPEFLGQDLRGTRSVTFADGSMQCAWLGTDGGQTTLTVHRSESAAERVLAQTEFLAFTPMPEVGPEAIALPAAYAAPLPDGGVVILSGLAGESLEDPSPVTPGVVAMVQAALEFAG